MMWDPEPKPELEAAIPEPSHRSRYAGDRYAARGLRMAEDSALAVLEKLKSLPPGMAEPFAKSLAKGTESLLAQQEKQLLYKKDFPPTLPEPPTKEICWNNSCADRKTMSS
jgi:hypothetical protein